MATKNYDDVERVAHGSDKHAELLAVGYQMTAEDAKAIVKANKETPGVYSLPEVRKAEAMLAALKYGKPPVVAKRKAWVRPIRAE